MVVGVNESKKVTCIGCEDAKGNLFLSCMVCRLSSHPGECTEYRHEFDMRIVQKVIPWDEIVRM